MKRMLWFLRVRLAEIEADAGVPGSRVKLALARAGYCGTFPPGTRFIWRE